MTNLEKLLKDGFDDRRDLDCALYEKRKGGNCFELNSREKCRDCRRETLEWLQEEYKPEYNWLENGDNLKPGDCIMVTSDRLCDKHIKRTFLFYKDGGFYTTADNEAISFIGEYVVWGNARLPEEEE